MQVFDIDGFSEQIDSAAALFIADLHLSPNTPALTQAFLKLVDAAQSAKVAAVYILGDWFDAWVGDDWLDDASGAWLLPIVEKLKQLKAGGTRIYFCHGNRDFGIAKPFLNHFGAKMLPNVSQLTHAGKTYRLEHGDLLCTDDVRYQRFRRIVRFALVLETLRRLPLERRKKIALKLRSQSTLENRNKPAYIMDVNEKAVATALKKCDALIHGHTHRPAVHELDSGKIRYVLGDWREIDGENTGNVEAVVGVLKRDFELIKVSTIKNTSHEPKTPAMNKSGFNHMNEFLDGLKTKEGVPELSLDDIAQIVKSPEI